LSITVEVRKGNLEQAMRVLKRKVQKEGIVKELKMRQYFEKPSEKKRRKKKENIANVKKLQKKLARLRGY
jgi:small subunit ribosomal protein S21|tara:strand:+ start:2160 stop:2369 length:210 start_codon:yes stop_codon:yes gene_type:complete